MKKFICRTFLIVTSPLSFCTLLMIGAWDGLLKGLIDGARYWYESFKKGWDK